MIVWFLDPMNFSFFSLSFLSGSIVLFDLRALLMFNIFRMILLLFAFLSLSLSFVFISLIFHDYYLLFVKWDFDAGWWIRNKLFLLVMYLGHSAFRFSCPSPKYITGTCCWFIGGYYCVSIFFLFWYFVFHYWLNQSLLFVAFMLH